MLPGKGPLKAQFEERVAKLRLRRVAFRTLWLSSEDYPRLLGEFFLATIVSFSRGPFSKKIDTLALLPLSGNAASSSRNYVLLVDLLSDLFTGEMPRSLPLGRNEGSGVAQIS